MTAVPTPISKAKKEPELSLGEIVEAVLFKGDLKSLNPKERAGYLRRLCESLGLNPLTRPFEFITLQGKLTLYCTKAATEQLRKIYGVSVTGTEESSLEDVYIVTAKVKMADGRTDEARGAVKIGGLKGDHLANALMKAETKAKRRATLSICGLGFMDESEIETAQSTQRKSSSAAKKDGQTEKDFNQICSDIRGAEDLTSLQEIQDAWAQEIAELPARWADLVSEEVSLRVEQLGGEASDENEAWGDEL